MARIKNWAKFQHFKDRRPPWIKLYRDILDDKEWHKLDPIAAKDLVSFWLIASEYDGELPDIETLAFRMRRPESDVLSSVSGLSHWLDQADITLMSSRHHVAPVADVSDHQERETERETEEEKEKKARAPRSPAPAPVLDGVPAELLSEWLVVRKAKRAGELTKTAIKGLDREAEKAGLTREQAVTACVEYSWQGFNASWYAERTGGKGGHAAASETAYQRSMRERMQQFAPGVAAKAPGFNNVIELEAHDVTARRLG